MALNRPVTVRWSWRALGALALLATPLRASAQVSHIPSQERADSLIVPEPPKDPRSGPHDAFNPNSHDLRVPKNEQKTWVNRDYYAIQDDEESRRIIHAVEVFHLGAKTNIRGFWPAYKQGDYPMAVGELKYALWVYPNHPNALQLLGTVAKAIGDPGIPIAYYEKALRLFPDRAFTHAQYGAYLVDTGEVDRGIVELEKALALDPDLLYARGWLDKARRARGLAQGTETSAPPP